MCWGSKWDAGQWRIGQGYGGQWDRSDQQGVSYFKVASGGHAGARGAWGGDQSRNASGVTHRQAWSVRTTLGWNGQVTLASGEHDGFRRAMGVTLEQVQLEGNMVGWTNGGHSSRVARGVILRQLVDH